MMSLHVLHKYRCFVGIGKHVLLPQFRRFCAAAIKLPFFDDEEREKADKVVRFSKTLADFRKFPMVGLKSAFKLADKYGKDGSFHSFADLERVLDFSDHQRSVFRSSFAEMLQSVQINENQESWHIISKSGTLKRSRTDVVSFASELITTHQDWQTVFSYCCDNHQFAYVVIDKSCTVLHSHNSRWEEYPGEPLVTGLAAEYKTLTFEKCRRIVENALRDVPTADILLTEKLFRLSPLKSSNTPPSFLVSSLMVSTMMYSHLVAKVLNSSTSAHVDFKESEHEDKDQRTYSYEIDKSNVYKFCNFPNVRNFFVRYNIEKDKANEICMEITQQSFALKVEKFDENAQTLIAAYIQALIFIKCNERFSTKPASTE